MKTFLFASYTQFSTGKLTGAHRRFLELMHHVAQKDQVIFLGREGSQDVVQNNQVVFYSIDAMLEKKLPAHISGAVAICRTLRKLRKKIAYDWAISFNPAITVAYHFAKAHNIVSLFREDLIGYQRALNASKKKIMYFQMQETLAVRASEKIIVQCHQDRNNLIKRNERFCKNIAQKVSIQINNANASWMNTDTLTPTERSDTPKILFIGNFSDRRKGHEILLPAMKRLLDEGYNAELLCAGDGKQLDFWKENCAAYPQIVFLGHVKDMREYLQQASFVIVPSLIDSCPNTVLEGLNAGVAVYGASTGGIPDLLQDSAYMFEANEEKIYLFLKDVLSSGRYQTDAVKQRVRKEKLSFCWGEKIREIIKGQFLGR